MARKRKDVARPVGETPAAVADSPAKAEAEASASVSPARFPVVGIGASAGGLAAFEAFFSGMPDGPGPGLAFVLVQHLAPDHESLLVDLVRRYTRMDVFQVEDGMSVRPDCVYIIPPNRDMAFIDGTLQLLEPAARRGQRLPIDFFFRSLALDQHERAIGIVLSGTGSDGTLGVRTIKGEGGMVMAQSPDSTAYDGMPRSAISTGMVDFELPPAEMPAQLVAYANHSLMQRRSATPSPTVESALKKIFVLLRAQTGHDFSHYKPSTVHRRIERRMAVQQIDSPDELVRYLRATPSEVDALFRDLLIGVTSFFRDTEAFEALETQVIGQVLARKPGDEPIRVWIPACSTGEEAYSLAILLAEAQQQLKRKRRFQIFATDIDARAIATARAGHYPGSIVADVSEERLARFFAAESPDASGRPSTYRIDKSLRDMLVFSEQDVIRDPPFSRLDLISCRNLLIYLDADLQRRLIPLFHYALRPGGFLFLGTSESVGDSADIFRTLDRKQKLYQSRENYAPGTRPGLARFAPPLLPSAPDESDAGPARAGAPSLPLRELTEQALLRATVPAAVLVTRTGDVLYIHGRTGNYLEPVPGAAGVSNILKMAREGLRLHLSAALHGAVSSNQTVRHPGIPVETNGNQVVVDLAVTPVTPGATPQAPLYLVVFAVGQREPAQPPPQSAGADRPEPGDPLARIAALEQELRTREEYLQSTTEELETANEELKSTNEELQSVNEELQSTNEELETSKEELQSVNEELSTVNIELEAKVVDLSRINNDMSNLLAGTGIGTVFVDTTLRILRFTPTATRIINLIASDVGRPVGHVASNLVGYPTLVPDVQEVLDTLAPKALEVQTTDHDWYSMRILPYRTLDNVIEGVVLTFVNISAERQARDLVHLNQERVRVALEASSIRLTNQDDSLRYTWALDPRDPAVSTELLGKTDADLLPADEAASLVSLKRRVLETGVGTRERVRSSLGGDTEVWDLTLEPLRDGADRVVGLTCAAVAIRDDAAGARRAGG